MNITKLKMWPELLAMGFEPIIWRAHGKIVCIGAALRKELTSIKGEKFKTDIICIQPTCNTHSDSKNYHITGEVKTPYVGKFYRYEYNRKIEFFDTITRINEFYKASQVLGVINTMLK